MNEKINNFVSSKHFPPIVLFVVAFIVRVVMLGYAELWCDEINFAVRSSPPLTPWGMFVDRVAHFSSMAYMPLPGMIHNAFLWLFYFFEKDIQHAVFLQRLPSAIFGALSVPLLYTLARMLVRKRVAFVAALMLCFFFFPFFYSRDARFYSTLLFFTLSSGVVYFRILESRKMGWGRGVLLYSLLLCAALSMLNGVIYVGAVCAVSSVCFVLSRLTQSKWMREHGRVFFVTAWIAFLTLLTISPLMVLYVIGLTQKTIGQVGGGTGADLPACVRDCVGKMLMGTRPWSQVLSYLLLVVALFASPWVRKEKRPLVLILLGITVSSFAVLWLGVAHNQYYFSRIFYMLVAFLYLLVAVGIDSIFSVLARCLGVRHRVATVLGPSVIVLLILIHIFLYVLPAYGLQSKHKMTYGKVADWINLSLPHGTPVLMDEFHEQRYIPTFFPVPTHPVLSAPKVKYPPEGKALHGTPLERVLTQFPELCWVETWGSLKEMDPRVDRIYQQFQHRHDITSENLRRMVASGIFPQGREDLSNLGDYGIRIWYNTKPDVVKKLKKEGHPLYFSYPGWSIMPVSRTQTGELMYARIADGGSASIQLENIAGDTVRGTLQVRGGVIAPPGKIRVFFGVSGQRTRSVEVKSGELWSIVVPEVVVPLTGGEFKIGVMSSFEKQTQGLLIQDIRLMDHEMTSDP